MTTAEQMAVAVLKGDLLAAKALADLLSENTSHGELQLSPIKTLSVTSDKLRAVVYVKDNIVMSEEDVIRVADRIKVWIDGRDDGVIVISGADRIEVYELPSGE